MDPELEVGEVMRTDFVSVKLGDQLDFADTVMRLGRIRHMPVLDGKQLVGVVSDRDVLAASLSKVLNFDFAQRKTFMRSVEVNEVMSKDLVSVRPETRLAQAAHLMMQCKIGCLPVVDDEGSPVGLVTETDLLRAAFGDDQARESSAG